MNNDYMKTDVFRLMKFQISKEDLGELDDVKECMV